MPVVHRPQLTQKQLQILSFIRTYYHRRGYQPSVREIGAEFGIRSPNGVQHHIDALARTRRDHPTSGYHSGWRAKVDWASGESPWAATLPAMGPSVATAA